MKTEIYQKDSLEQAAKQLQQEEVVAFPTETVQGLGAIASSQTAVERVYKAKGRPSDNPLIVHVSSVEQVIDSVTDFPEMAQKLADSFWPGPLTIILHPKENLFAKAVSAGLPTASFRMPNHPLTLELIERVGEPIVGPSANKSTRPSPTSAQHVLDDLDGLISGVVDGGATSVGVESTVLDLTSQYGPVILRPGVITKEEIEAVIGKIVDKDDLTVSEAEKPKAPGMKYRHYSPVKPVVAIAGKQALWQKEIDQLVAKGEKIALMANTELVAAFKDLASATYTLGEPGDITAMNRLLFDGLRVLDKSDSDIILVEASPKVGQGLAYMNRLEKAAVEYIQ